MDHDSKIRLTVEDNTAAGLKSAAANIKKVNDLAAKSYAPVKAAGADWARAAETSAKRLGTSIDDVARRQSEFGRVTQNTAKHITNFGSTGSSAFKTVSKGIEEGNAALVAMAGRYLGVAAAAEVARKSFLGFAATDQRLRLLQNDAGATRKEIDATSDSLKKLSLETATNMEPLIEGFNELRESANLSLKETEAIFPKVAKAAKGSGMDVVALGRTVGDMMRNMKVPAEDVDKALEAITFGVQDLRLNADALSKNAPKVLESMAEWGYKGADGINRMVAFMGSLQKVTGSTEKSSMALNRIMETMQSGELSPDLGFDTKEGLTKYLREAQEAGKDVLGVYIGLLANAKDRDAVMGKIGLRERGAVRALINDYEVMSKRINDIASSQGRAASSFKNVMDGPQAKIDQMLISLDLLAKQFGQLLHEIGTTTAIQWVTKQIQELIKEIKAATELWNYLFNKGKKPAFLPQTLDELDDLMWGKKGESALRKGLPTLGERFTGERPKYDVEPLPQDMEEKLRLKGEERQKELDATKGERQKEDELRRKGMERFKELNGQVDELTGNIKKMSLSMEDSTGARVWNASLGNRGFGHAGGVTNASYTTAPAGTVPAGGVMNASYTTGGGTAGGYAPGQTAGPAGAYGGGTAFGPQGMGPSPNAAARGGGPAPVPSGGTTAPSSEPGGGTVPQAAGSAAASGSYQGERVNQDVMGTRIQQANSEWMKDPKNQQLIYRTLQAEGGMSNMGANLEQMSNYAASRGKTLQQVVEARGNKQFYGPLRRFRGDPGSGPMMPHERDAYNSAWTPEKQKALDNARREVFEGGSNRIGYRTDQGTVGDPNYNPSKMVKVGGNMYGVQPGTEKWVNEQRGKPQASVGNTQVASTAPGASVGGGSTSAAQVLPGTVAGGGASPGAKEKWEQQGIMTMEGKEYRYGSGGGGKGATPAGSYNINMDSRLGISGPGGRGTLGNVGKRIGSIATVGGLSGEINRGRAGIQIHQALTKRLDKLYTAGCFGIEPKQWPAYREHLLDMARRNPGGLRLDVGEDGRAQVVVRGTPLPMPGGQPAVAGSGAATPASSATAAQSVPSPPTGDKIEPLQPGPPKTSAEEKDKIGPLQPGPPKASSTEEVDKEMRLNVKVNDNDMQFAKRSMRREADREVREARWSSYSDIGAA
jgi:phage-related minor tail protein